MSGVPHRGPRSFTSHQIRYDSVMHFSGRKTFISLSLFLALLAGNAAAWAQDAERPPPSAPPERTEAPRPPAGRSESHTSLSDAVRRVQRSTGGQVLSAERVQFEGRNINRVKYVDDRGRVRYMDDPGAAARRDGPSRPRRDLPNDPAPRSDPASW